MTAAFNTYANPLTERYASKQMCRLFSPQTKFSTWRKLWLALAEAQAQQGLPISKKQLQEMRNHLTLTSEDFALAAKKEKVLRHDVMAHLETFAAACPTAAPIIHLGATSCYVTDNTDLIQMREGLLLLLLKLKEILTVLGKFAEQHRALPTLSYTHFQPAQPTTVGKRAALWAQALLFDFEEIEQLRNRLPLRGLKGTTGTQASFLHLLKTDAKVEAVEKAIAKRFRFKKVCCLTGQTYSRKWDDRIAAALSSLAQSCAKFATDLRLLQHKKEIEEPFEKSQTGSSAMPYKRNPMRSERICSLARFLMALPNSTAHTAATQWLERTLDDSANKRLFLQQGFLAADGLLELMRNVTKGLVVYPKVIEKNLLEELPFMTTENLMMEAVKKGGHRQELHKRLQRHTQKAAKAIKEKGAANPLWELLAEDPTFPLTKNQLAKLKKPTSLRQFTGRSETQVQLFLKQELQPHLKPRLEKEDQLEAEELLA